MAASRDPSQRVFNLSESEVQELLESIHPELTFNETKKLIEKVNEIAHSRGLPTRFEIEDAEGPDSG